MKEGFICDLFSRRRREENHVTLRENFAFRTSQTPDVSRALVKRALSTPAIQAVSESRIFEQNKHFLRYVAVSVVHQEHQETLIMDDINKMVFDKTTEVAQKFN